jgi:hypothetical protein
MADLPATTAELQVYLTHLRHAGCEYGVSHLPCFFHMQVRFEGRNETIRWIAKLMGHFRDLKGISHISYKDYVACMLAESGCGNAALQSEASDFEAPDSQA